MRNVLLITGVGGFVGSHAVRFAVQDPKYDLILANDIFFPGNLEKSEKIIFFAADLSKLQDLKKISAILEKIPDYKLTIWHIGGCFNYSAPRELLFRINVEGTRNLADAVLALGLEKIQRFVFWSGGTVYGDFDHPQGHLPADENYPACPNNSYGASKKAAEDILQFFNWRFGLPTTIMRLGAIYGSGSRYGIANVFMLNHGGYLAPVLVGNPQNHAALIHVQDVIRVADFLSAAPESVGEIFNVTDVVPRTVKEVSVLVGRELWNKPFSRFYLPSWVLRYLIKLAEKHAKRTGGRLIIDVELGNLTLLNSWMSNRKLMLLAEKHGRNETLFLYPDALVGLRKTIDWYKKGAS